MDIVEQMLKMRRMRVAFNFFLIVVALLQLYDRTIVVTVATLHPCASSGQSIITSSISSDLAVISSVTRGPSSALMTVASPVNIVPPAFDVCDLSGRARRLRMSRCVTTIEILDKKMSVLQSPKIKKVQKDPLAVRSYMAE